jgi:hypothetical protein
MGDINQYKWVERLASKGAPPVLEIGSRHYKENTANNFRTLFPGQDYCGVDISEGLNVDRVVDFTKGYDEILAALDGRRFKTIICMSVMEHVTDIFTFAQNLSRIAAPGAAMFMSVPFAWRFHGYPSDYWRFTPRAVRQLFPAFEFEDNNSMLSSNVVGDVAAFQEDPNAFSVRKLSRNPLAKLAFWRTPYLVKPTMVSMFGRRAAD